MSKFIDLTGQRFTRLLVIKRILNKSSATWECLCDCGVTKAVTTGNLRSSKQKSCGCLNTEMRQQRNEARKTSEDHKRDLDLQRKAKYNKSEKGKQAQKKYLDANREQVYARAKVWVANNPEARRAMTRLRRRRLKEAAGTHSQEDISIIGEEQGWRCTCCDVDITSNFEVDHVTPISKGGTNCKNNIQLLCPSCNKSKSAKPLESFLAETYPHLYGAQKDGAAYIALAGEAASQLAS